MAEQAKSVLAQRWEVEEDQSSDSGWMVCNGARIASGCVYTLIKLRDLHNASVLAQEAWGLAMAWLDKQSLVEIAREYDGGGVKIVAWFGNVNDMQPSLVGKGETLAEAFAQAIQAP